MLFVLLWLKLQSTSTDRKGKLMTESKFLKLFKAHIFNKHGTQSAAAEYWGVSNNFVSLVVNGVRRPNSDMLNDMGLTLKSETVKTYKKI